MSKVGHQHTFKEHTPKRNLYQQAIFVGSIPFIVGPGKLQVDPGP